MRHTTFNLYEREEEPSTAEKLAFAVVFITMLAIGQHLAESLWPHLFG